MAVAPVLSALNTMLGGPGSAERLCPEDSGSRDGSCSCSLRIEYYVRRVSPETLSGGYRDAADKPVPFSPRCIAFHAVVVYIAEAGNAVS